MKKDLIGLVAIVLLIVGAIFVSAHLTSDKEETSQPVEEISENAETCGPNNCNFNCGGNCGVPTCGCGR